MANKFCQKNGLPKVCHFQAISENEFMDALE
jgi:hypothetical protein